MGKRIYTEIVSIGSIDIYEVSADPNTVLDAPLGSLAARSDAAVLYQNTDGATTWVAIGGGGGIPNGTFVGDMTAWDGAQWTRGQAANWDLDVGGSHFLLQNGTGADSGFSIAKGGAIGAAVPHVTLVGSEGGADNPSGTLQATSDPTGPGDSATVYVGPDPNGDGTSNYLSQISGGSATNGTSIIVNAEKGVGQGIRADWVDRP